MKGLFERRGQNLSISTLVIIILAIIVLVFLILGFTIGWQNLFDRVTNLGGGDSNVQAIVTACSIACNTNSVFDYCSLQRDVDFGNGEDEQRLTCDSLEGMNVGLEACEQITCSGVGSADSGDNDGDGVPDSLQAP